ncbi:MAG: hypothetical protein FWD92_06140 [Methanomassiliicoccaceae archaeon]|nr:hypothetical protein [Methanomassiliicoccaceae archaeon]
MDAEKAFVSIQTDIRNNEYENAMLKVKGIADACDDVNSLLKCASLLKVVEDEEGCQNILNRIAGMSPFRKEERLNVALSLRNLGRPDDAYGIIRDEEETDNMLREKAKTLLLMGEGGEALSKIGKLSSHTAEDRILLSEILCSTGDFKKAYEVSSKLAKDDRSYDSMANLCTTLVLMGKSKEAIKTAKQNLKGEKDADSLALAAYVMRIDGRTTPAAAYAYRALNADHVHKGALETMALCLIEKSRFFEAKMLAGGINERYPGDPAAIRILDACREASR